VPWGWCCRRSQSSHRPIWPRNASSRWRASEAAAQPQGPRGPTGHRMNGLWARVPRSLDVAGGRPPPPPPETPPAATPSRTGHLSGSIPGGGGFGRQPLWPSILSRQSDQPCALRTGAVPGQGNPWAHSPRPRVEPTMSIALPSPLPPPKRLSAGRPAVSRDGSSSSRLGLDGGRRHPMWTDAGSFSNSWNLMAGGSVSHTMWPNQNRRERINHFRQLGYNPVCFCSQIGFGNAGKDPD